MPNLTTFCKAFLAFILNIFLLIIPVYPAILLTEDFESVAPGQIPPSGWATEMINGSNYLFFFATGTFPSCTPYSGARLVEFQSFNAAAGVQNRLKRTQSVSTIGYTNVVIDFAWFTDPGYINSKDKAEVQWSTNGISWTTAATFFRYDSVQQWSIKTVPLPAEASGQATLYIGFLFTADFGDNCHLDLIHISANGNTGIEETGITAMKIYPNPANDWLFIEPTDQDQQPEQVRFFTVNGREVLNFVPGQSQDKVKAPVSSLSEGMYILGIITRDGLLSKKIVIRR